MKSMSINNWIARSVRVTFLSGLKRPFRGRKKWPPFGWSKGHLEEALEGQLLYKLVQMFSYMFCSSTILAEKVQIIHERYWKVRIKWYEKLGRTKCPPPKLTVFFPLKIDLPKRRSKSLTTNLAGCELLVSWSFFFLWLLNIIGSLKWSQYDSWYSLCWYVKNKWPNRYLEVPYTTSYWYIHLTWSQLW